MFRKNIKVRHWKKPMLFVKTMNNLQKSCSASHCILLLEISLIYWFTRIKWLWNVYYPAAEDPILPHFLIWFCFFFFNPITYCCRPVISLLSNISARRFNGAISGMPLVIFAIVKPFDCSWTFTDSKWLPALAWCTWWPPTCACGSAPWCWSPSKRSLPTIWSAVITQRMGSFWVNASKITIKTQNLSVV